MWKFIKKLFGCYEEPVEEAPLVVEPAKEVLSTAEPVITINPSDVDEPCVRISVENKSLLLSGAQARRVWGKLGANLEKMTPDKE